MGTKYANCYDETGANILWIAVSTDMTMDQFKNSYPECQFRFWHEYSVDPKLAYRMPVAQIDPSVEEINKESEVN